MIATLIVIAVILVTMAVFYWKASLVTMLTTILSAIFASIVAFTYYEIVSNLCISKGWLTGWIHSLSFLVLFFLTLFLLRILSDFIINSKIDLGTTVQLASTLICGLFAGLLIAGHLLIALSMMPVSPGLYLRYSPEQPLRVNDPSAPLLKPDGLSAALYSWISRGSLSSSKSFAVYHPDYIQQTHVNRWAMSKDITPVLSPGAVKIPSGGQKAVRTRDLADNPNTTVVRVGVSAAEIKSGGAKDADGKISFIPAQVPIVTIPKALETAGKYRGTGTLIYPKGVVENNNVVKLELNQVLAFDNDDYASDRMVWLDLAYEIPSDSLPVLLAFKQNAVVDLPKAVQSTEELEEELKKNQTTRVNL